MNTQQFAGEVWLRVDNAVCCHASVSANNRHARMSGFLDDDGIAYHR